jgi:hypothetical protein
LAIAITWYISSTSAVDAAPVGVLSGNHHCLPEPLLVLFVRAIHDIVVAVDVSPAINHDVEAWPVAKEVSGVVALGNANLDRSPAKPDRLQVQREHVSMNWLNHETRTVVRASSEIL